ncbi:MAG: Mur ligase family protein [Patescibacteria group bacterium]|jgi:UDP-N-acetylmuramoyl-tripeptide--D-alanyl-D-alanine ligase|nr:Mur ligase family protein [Patescibacteria group bacterium]
MRKILQFILKIIAKLVLKKYKPKIIGVTGSVGKTTTKEAVFTVLSKKYRVGKSLKNYNNEIGLPLSILGFESPGKNILSWFFLFLEGFRMLTKKDKFYPEILVLEMGVDRPGDMDYLNKILKCDIGVITNVGMSHIEYFGTIDKIKREKAKIITNLNKKGLAVINYDNEKSREIISLSKEKVISYGFDERADVRAEELRFKFDNKNSGFSGINFKLRYKGSVVPVFMNGSIGYHLVYASLVASIVGREFGMNLLEISEALRDFKSPKGRLNILEGINDSVLIDDTYNSSPQSSLKAIETLSEIESEEGRKIVILGDMLELGDESDEEHYKIGWNIAKYKIDTLLCVGEFAKNICSGALKGKMNKTQVFHFESQKDLVEHVESKIEEGDLVLVKGSQGARMEKIVKILLKNKEQSTEFLVRQDEDWLSS